MPRLMARVDEQLEILRRAEPAGRREEPEHLVAPRSGERMLHHRQQLDVREAHLLHVRHEPRGQLAVGEEPVALLPARAPTIRGALRTPTSAGRASRPAARASRHPVAVAPGVAARCRATIDAGLRRRFERDAERIGLLQHARRLASGSRTCTSRRRPDPGRRVPRRRSAEIPHRVDAAVPPVEVADDAHALARSAPTPRSARRSSCRSGCGARPASRTRGAACLRAKQVQIEVGDDAAVTIRIVDLAGVAAGIRDEQAVVGNPAGRIELGFKDRRSGAARHRYGLPRCDEPDVDVRRRRMDRAHDHPSVAFLVRPEQGERVGTYPAAKRRERIVEVRRLCRRHAVHLIGNSRSIPAHAKLCRCDRPLPLSQSFLRQLCVPPLCSRNRRSRTRPAVARCTSGSAQAVTCRTSAAATRHRR